MAWVLRARSRRVGGAVCGTLPRVDTVPALHTAEAAVRLTPECPRGAWSRPAPCGLSATRTRAASMSQADGRRSWTAPFPWRARAPDAHGVHAHGHNWTSVLCRGTDAQSFRCHRSHGNSSFRLTV